MAEIACRDVDERLAAYAARGLEEAEHLAVAEHLAECRRHDAELGEARETLELVALAVEPVAPPARLRSGLLEAFDREVAGVAVPAQPSAPALPQSPRPRAGIGYALAAALLIVSVGLGIWGLSRGDSGSQVLVRSASADGYSLQITYLVEHDLVVLELELPAPPSDQVYQAWRIDAAGATSLGLLEDHSGRAVFEAGLEGASAVALSLEPEGGSEQPTTEPIISTSLPGG